MRRISMKAVAVIPGKPDSVHLAEVPNPLVGAIPNGRGVKVKVLQVGLDGTDKEINAALYGAPPKGEAFLIIGHENFGRVEEVGPNVVDLILGDYVVAMVRRPGSSLYDRIGAYDMSTDETFLERGINGLHGYLAEAYVEDTDYLVKLPPVLKKTGVLLEPTTVAEKGITQACEIQRRLRVWQPRRAAVLGAGTIGLLATLLLRLRGIEVTTFALPRKPYRNGDLVEALGARYESTMERSLLEGSRRYGPFDMIFEATGFSPLAFEAMQALGKNGVLILSSVTGGDRKIEIPSDKINLGFVLGNKVMVGTVSAGREDFEQGIRDLIQCETLFPSWLERLLTHRVVGLENYRELFESLETAQDAIKIYCAVAHS